MNRLIGLINRLLHPAKNRYWVRYDGWGGMVYAYGMGHAKRCAWERVKQHYPSVTFEWFCKDVCVKKEG